MALTALTKKALALLKKLARNVTRKRIEYVLNILFARNKVKLIKFSHS